ncbi:hypothetical protein [Sphingobium olei]|uniref:Alpha/beta hydrolase n=1 Tax=Sphingobium olei TaxID=420955 RepID=A0ABW3NWK2_9SPHN
MTIIYVHGVNVRTAEHGEILGKPLRRWLGPKLGVNGAEPGYEPVYWGDHGVKFRWNLASRPKTQLLRQGATGSAMAGLGSLRGNPDVTPFDRAAPQPVRSGPVLGRPKDADQMSSLALVRPDERADFIADLYLACLPGTVDPVVERPQVAALAVAASMIAANWDEIMRAEASEGDRARALVRAVDADLRGSRALPMGGAADWFARAGELVRRAPLWPGDAVSVLLGEARPYANELFARFTGDVFTYLTQRGEQGRPGDIPRLLLAALRRAQARKNETGEKIVVVSHSMGGQLVYDALTYFAEGDNILDKLEVDHWISFGSQVSLFAEMGMFLSQGAGDPAKLPLPRRVQAWTNFYDENDPVGFVMEPVFEGVQDIRYNTGYGLALAHTGFLARPTFFQAMANRL